MPIALHLMTVNGAISEYHVIKRLETNFEKNLHMVSVLSYSSEQAFLSGGTTVQQLPVKVPPEACTYPLEDSLATWLTTIPESPFFGGVIVADNSQTLAAAQDRAWARMKVIRSQREVGDFTFEDGVYQADVARITGAATLALMAQGSGKEFSTSWTLTDNSVRLLTGPQIMGLGIAVGQYVDSLYAVARAKRSAIYASGTVEAVNAIDWSPGETLESAEAQAATATATVWPDTASVVAEEAAPVLSEYARLAALAPKQ